MSSRKLSESATTDSKCSSATHTWVWYDLEGWQPVFVVESVTLDCTISTWSWQGDVNEPMMRVSACEPHSRYCNLLLQIVGQSTMGCHAEWLLSHNASSWPAIGSCPSPGMVGKLALQGAYTKSAGKVAWLCDCDTHGRPLLPQAPTLFASAASSANS